MSEVEFPPPSLPRKPSRRGVFVAVAAIVMAVASGTVAVLALSRSNEVRDELTKARSALRQLSDNQLEERSQGRELERQLDDLTDVINQEAEDVKRLRSFVDGTYATLETVRDDLAATSATVSIIDSYLRDVDLSTIISDLGYRVDDLTSCLNDNLDAISRRAQLSYCG